MDFWRSDLQLKKWMFLWKSQNSSFDFLTFNFFKYFGEEARWVWDLTPQISSSAKNLCSLNIFAVTQLWSKSFVTSLSPVTSAKFNDRAEKITKILNFNLVCCPLAQVTFPLCHLGKQHTQYLLSLSYLRCNDNKSNATQVTDSR